MLIFFLLLFGFISLLFFVVLLPLVIVLMHVAVVEEEIQCFTVTAITTSHAMRRMLRSLDLTTAVEMKGQLLLMLQWCPSSSHEVMRWWWRGHTMTSELLMMESVVASILQ